MFRKNGLKKIVLQCVGEMKGASSREISNKLGCLSVSDRKKVSMTLLKCKRQRLLERTLLKRGRVREYSYVITERGKKRLAYYTLQDGKVKFGVFNIDEMVKAARKQVNPLLMSALLSFDCVESICSKTRQTVVFSKGKECAFLSTYPILNKPELISAFAAKELLDVISPEISAAIRNATTELLNRDIVSTMEMFTIGSGLNKLISLSPPVDHDIILILMIRRLNELHLQQWLLYRMLKDEEREKEEYKCMYEVEKIVGSSSAAALEMHTRRFDAYKFTLENIYLIYRSTQSIIATDQKIIEQLTKEHARMSENNSDLLLCVVHYLIAYAKENVELRAEIRRLEEREEQHAREIQELEDRILQDCTILPKSTELPFNIIR